MTTVTAVRKSQRDLAAGYAGSLPWPAFALVGLLLVLARRPEALLAAEFNWEEANAFYVPTFFLDPVAQLMEPWGGTFQVVPRLAYMTLRAVPVVWAPLAENLLALSAAVAVAAFIASRRLHALIPDGRLRLLVGALLLAIPAQRDVMGGLMNSQWYGGILLMLLPMATVPVSHAGRWLERVLVVLVGLTGPFSLLLAPAYAWKLFREARPSGHLKWLAGIVVACGLVQLAMIVATGRAETSEQRPLELALVNFWLHGAIVPVLGERLSNAIGSAGIHAALLFVGGVALVMGLAFTAWRSLPRSAMLPLYGAIVIATSGIAVHEGANVWPPGAYERYFLPAAVLVVAIVVTGARRGHPLAAILAVLLGVGIVSDFRLDPYPRQGWERTHSCIHRATPCSIAIWPRDYDVHWPGAEGTYEIPSHVDP